MFLSPRRVVSVLVVGMIALAWSLPITTRMIGDGDFPTHLLVAESVAANPHLPAPHFLFFVCVALLMRTLAISSHAAGIIVISMVHIGTAALIAAYLQRQTGTISVISVVVAIGLLVAGPILPPFVELTQYLIGYAPPNAFHNATFIVSKPFCLLLLLTTAAVFSPDAGRFLWARSVAVVVLSAISKPNYLVAVVPAALIGAWSRLPRRRTNQVALVSLVATAATVLLVMQRAYAESDAQVVFAPFAALRFHTSIDVSLAAKALASLAFPLAVAVLWPCLVRRRHDISLAWLATLVAFAQGYLFAEAGPRMDHANLLVAAPQAVFVLLVVSASGLMSLPRATHTGESVRRTVAWAVFALHVVGGYRYVGVKVPFSSFVAPLTAVALLTFVAWAAWTIQGSRQPSATGSYRILRKPT